LFIILFYIMTFSMGAEIYFFVRCGVKIFNIRIFWVKFLY
jgi:hypothetical protein